MDEKKFKANNKPAACTRPPWARLIPKQDRGAVLAEIRQQSNEVYGQSYDECPKRHVCMGKECLGRPLPTKVKAFKPYLEELKKIYKIENNELFLSNCETCPIKSSCSSPCAQINDFINRSKKMEVELVYKDSLENLTEKAEGVTTSLPFLKGYTIPWDCVSPRKQRIVKKYLFERQDFLTIARQEKLHDQARTKYEYYSALSKLSEYAIMRKFLKSGQKLTQSQKVLLEEVYFSNKNLAQAAKDLGITRQAAQYKLQRVLNKYDLKWHKFVKKEKQSGKIRVVYNIPEVLR